MLLVCGQCNCTESLRNSVLATALCLSIVSQRLHGISKPPASVTIVQGLEDMQQHDRDSFFSQFDVSAEDQEAFNKEHPAPVAPAEPEPAKKKQKTV